MKTFKEYLQEMPEAIQGDYNTSVSEKLDFIDNEYISEFNFKKIDTISGFELYHSTETNTADNTYILLDKKIPVMYFTFDNDKFENKKVSVVLYIGISKKYRSKGIAKMIYQYFNKKGHSLVSDTDQYDGSRRLWKSLSQSNHVDYIDLENNKVIESNIKITNINDERYWDTNNNYRFLLI